VTYTKDLFLKEKNPPKLPYLQGQKKKKKKKKRVEITIFRPKVLCIWPIYIQAGFPKKKSKFYFPLSAVAKFG